MINRRPGGQLAAPFAIDTVTSAETNPSISSNARQITRGRVTNRRWIRTRINTCLRAVSSTGQAGRT